MLTSALLGTALGVLFNDSASKKWFVFPIMGTIYGALLPITYHLLGRKATIGSVIGTIVIGIDLVTWERSKKTELYFWKSMAFLTVGTILGASIGYKFDKIKSILKHVLPFTVFGAYSGFSYAIITSRITEENPSISSIIKRSGDGAFLAALLFLFTRIGHLIKEKKSFSWAWIMNILEIKSIKQVLLFTACGAGLGFVITTLNSGVKKANLSISSIIKISGEMAFYSTVLGLIEYFGGIQAGAGAYIMMSRDNLTGERFKFNFTTVFFGAVGGYIVLPAQRPNRFRLWHPLERGL